MSNQAALLATLKGLKGASSPPPSAGSAKGSKKGSATVMGAGKGSDSPASSPAPPVLPASASDARALAPREPLASPSGSGALKSPAQKSGTTFPSALSPGPLSPRSTAAGPSKHELPIQTVLQESGSPSLASFERCCPTKDGLFPSIEIAPTMLAKLRMMPGDPVALKPTFDLAAAPSASTGATGSLLSLPFLVGSAFPARGVAEGAVRLPSSTLLPDAILVELVDEDEDEDKEATPRPELGRRTLRVPLRWQEGGSLARGFMSLSPLRPEEYSHRIQQAEEATVRCVRRVRSRLGNGVPGEASASAPAPASGEGEVEVDVAAAPATGAIEAASKQHSLCGLVCASTVLTLPTEASTGNSSRRVRVNSTPVFRGAALLSAAKARSGGGALPSPLKTIKAGDSIHIRAKMTPPSRASSTIDLVALGSTTAFSPVSAPLPAEPVTAPVAAAATPDFDDEEKEDENSDPVLAQLAATARACLFQSELYRGYGLSPPKGALLAGPPGTGKTLMATRLSKLLNVPLLALNTASVISPLIGETEARIKKAFQAAREKSASTTARAPGQPHGGCILFIDEIDGLAPRRDAGAGSFSEVDARVVATLLACMDGLVSKSSSSSSSSSSTSTSPLATVSDAGPVFILAATNRASAVDPALRRPGRLDTEILVSAPSEAERRVILRRCLRKYKNGSGGIARNDATGIIEEIARVTHGYVGADLDALAREAAACAVRRACLAPSSSSSSTTTTDAAALVEILPSDLHAALRVVQPSALREVSVEVPHVRWHDIAGQDATKRRLLEAVEWPLTHADAFKRMGIRPLRGVLLYGPPGCSKTLMAKAMATESSMNFLSVKGPELFSCYVGDSEKAVAEVFQRARSVAPCVIFFDELDALAGKRDADGGGRGGSGPSVGTRVVSQLLAELDGISGLKQVVVVGATNRPDLIDSALLRPGRIDALLFVGPPDEAAISDLIDRQLKTIPHAVFSPSSCWKDKKELVDALKGYSGAEIVAVFRDAAIRAVSSSLNGVGAGTPAPLLLLPEHLQAAIGATPKQITEEMMAFYHNFAKGSNKGGGARS